MRERPILFSAPMVRAILEGRKTQTRRVSGFDVINAEPDRYEFLGMVSGPGSPHAAFHDKTSGAQVLVRSRYGQSGDRLWMRETWAIRWYQGGWHVYFDADGEHSRRDEVGAFPLGKGKAGRLRPSIHMPRWASRITLEVTGVRVERLQAVSQSDAMAEGAPPSHPSIDRISNEYGFEDFPRSWFGQLWESINGAGSWAANPWVWVVEFRRVEHAHG